jgi:hypothetical protein
VLLLMLPAAAHAKTGGAVSPETVGQIIAALVTVLGGGSGLLWYRRHQHGAEGREELSARARVAIARDNDEKEMRARIDRYTAQMEALREELGELRSAFGVLGAEHGALQRRVEGVADALQQQQQRAERRQDHGQMLAAVASLEHQLRLALEDIARRGGDHRAR